MIFTKQDKFYLLFVLVVAAFLRIWGDSWGIPHIYHPDERFMVSRGVLFLSGDFNPKLFIYPSFLMYILYVVNLIVYSIGHLLGMFESIDSFAEMYRNNPAVFYLPNRVVIGLLSTISVYLGYVVTKKIYNKKTAQIFALVFAVLPVVVLHSHYVTTDVPVIPFIILSFYFCLGVLESEKKTNYYLAALFGGLAAGVKYNGGLIVVLIFVAHWMKRWEGSKGSKVERVKAMLTSTFEGKLIFAALTSLAVFVASSPFTVLDLKTFVKDFIFQVQVQRRGHGLIFIATGNKLLYQIFVNLKQWGGTPLLGLMILSWLALLPPKDKKVNLTLFWILIYFGALLSSNDRFVRYTLVLAPFLLLILSNFIYRFIFLQRVTVLKTAGIVLANATILYMLTFSILISHRLSKDDSRTAAKEWFEGNVQEGAPVGIVTSSTGMQNRDDPPIDSTRYQIIYSKDVSALLQQKPQWIILSRYDYIDILRIRDRYEFTKDSYYALTQLFNDSTEYRLVKEFDNSPSLAGHQFLGKHPSHDMMYSFPKISVYKR